MDTDFILNTPDYIKVFDDGILMVAFWDEMDIESKNEEEQGKEPVWELYFLSSFFVLFFG